MSILRTFSATQRLLEERKLLTGSRLVGYVISADFDAFTVSTCTALQNTAGPLSRGGFALAMAESSPDTAILLRVQGTARTPGYVHLMTASQRYPIPVQITSFAEIKGGVA